MKTETVGPPQAASKLGLLILTGWIFWGSIPAHAQVCGETRECIELAARTQFTVSAYVSKLVGEELARELDDDLEQLARTTLSDSRFTLSPAAPNRLSIDVSGAPNSCGGTAVVVALRVSTDVLIPMENGQCRLSVVIWQKDMLETVDNANSRSRITSTAEFLLGEFVRVLRQSNPESR